MSNEYKRPAVILTEEMKRAARNAPLPMVLLDSISARQDVEFESKFNAAIAAAPQPQALGGEPGQLRDGYLIKLANIAAPHHDRDNDMFYIAMAKLVAAPLQAEIEQLTHELNCAKGLANLTEGNLAEAKEERDQLKAEAEQLSETSMSQESMIEQLMALRDEQAKALHTLISVARTVNRNDASEIRVPGDDEPQYRQRKEWIEYLLEICAEAEALSKPAGSEQA